LLWAGLMPVVRRVRITLRLRNIEPLRIGASRESALLGSSVDLPVYRQAVVIGDRVVEEPVIPGSSLKGVLRTAVMALSASCGLETHSGVGRDNCVSEFFHNPGAFDRFRKRNSADIVRSVLLGFCPACLMFGAPSLAGRIKVGDFIPVNRVRLRVKTSVGINRRTGAAQENALYTVEFVEPGTVFKGYVEAVNVPNWMLSLLAAALLAIGQGWFKLGGFKSRGMGRVEVVGAEIVVENHSSNRCLDKLDKDVDEPVELLACRCEAARLVCSGDAGLEVLRALASEWGSKYCDKLREIYPKRREWASHVAEQGG